MGIKIIDHELCTGCAACVRYCPMDVLRLDTFIIEKPEFTPCQVACPAGVNMRDYNFLLTQGRLDEAVRLLRDALPLPAVTGRVCFHPCESECARAEVDEAVNIKSLERFVADYRLKEKAVNIPRVHEERVAIIGSGPAGLAAAQELARLGYPVTIFESLPVLGGMLRVGIPDYRLPKDVLEIQINYIKELGVETRTSTSVGKDLSLDDIFKQGYKAIFVAVGAHLSQELGIKGEKAEGVIQGLTFLRELNLGRKVTVGDRVAVIGGGNAAIDAARSAWRLGAPEVSILYRRSRVEMPAIDEEIEAAVAEGIDIKYQVVPTEILSQDGKVTGIKCVRTKLEAPDASGRLQPVPVSGTEFDISVDMVITAIGQKSDLLLLPKEARAPFIVELLTLETALPGVFAGGDMVAGPSSVVEAIASGKRAAISIDRFLKGEDLKVGRDEEVMRVNKPPKGEIEKRPKCLTPLLPVKHRTGNFQEVQTGFSEELAAVEAQRCMACGSKAFIKYVRDCQSCYLCKMVCPEEAIEVMPVFERRMPLA